MQSWKSVCGAAAVLMAASLQVVPAWAADPASIVVSGSGEVRTMPDLATVTFQVRGEGATADAATTALVKTLGNVRGEIQNLPKTTVSISTGEMGLNAVRSPDCKTGYDDGPQLSTGPCAVKGFVATMAIEAEVSPPEQAGTALGLAARMGAEDGSVSSYSLRDSSPAEKKAFAAALADARSKATAIAESAGGRLGALVGVVDAAADSEPMYAVYTDAAAPLPIPPAKVQPRPPVDVELTLKPISTSARLNVTYMVAP